MCNLVHPEKIPLTPGPSKWWGFSFKIWNKEKCRVIFSDSIHIFYFSTYIFHHLHSNCVNEVSCGEVYNDRVNIPGPLAQWPERDPLQVMTQCVLTAGAQSTGVPPETGTVLISSFQVLPPGVAILHLRSGWDNKHCPILSLSPVLLLLVCNISVHACVTPAAGFFLHREHWQSRLQLSCLLPPSLRSGRERICPNLVWEFSCSSWDFFFVFFNYKENKVTNGQNPPKIAALQLKNMCFYILHIDPHCISSTLPLSWLAFLLVSQPSFLYVSVWPPASSCR